MIPTLLLDLQKVQLFNMRRPCLSRKGRGSLRGPMRAPNPKNFELNGIIVLWLARYWPWPRFILLLASRIL